MSLYKDIKKIKELGDYLETIKNLVGGGGYIIIIAVRDITGQYLNDQYSLILQNMGFKHKLSWEAVGKRHRAYIGILKHSEVFFEAISKNGEPLEYKSTIMGYDIYISSMTWKKGNCSIIEIDGNDYSTNKRGINITVFDSYTGTLIDSVGFDTHLPGIPCSRLYEDIEKFVSKINSIHYAGYSFAQYCVDSGVNNIIVYCAKRWLPLLESVLLSFRNNIKIKVKQYISDDSFLHEYKNTEELGNINFRKFDISDIKKDDTIIIISPQSNKKLSALSNQFKIVELFNVIKEMYDYAYYYRPICYFRRIYPNVRIILYTGFWMPPAKDMSEYEKKCSKWRLKGFLKILKAGEKLEAFDEFGYTNDEIIEMSTQPPSYLNEKGIKIYNDKESKYINIRNGRRITIGQPETADYTVFTLGSCQDWGHTGPDSGTLASWLQLLYNNAGLNVKVENYASYNWSIKETLLYTLFDLPVGDNDVITMKVPVPPKFLQLEAINIEFLDITKILLRPHNYNEPFSYNCHINENGRRAAADALFKILNTHSLANHPFDKSKVPDISALSLFGIPESSLSQNQFKLNSEYADELCGYKAMLSETHTRIFGKIGSIVMNCNPFTYGHRYLIEWAASQVKHLFIFVVEEDKSIFPFVDRFQLIKEGTADLPNVTVLPSGKFIISNLTFQDYFNKAEIQDRAIDPSMDIELFAREITPAIGINVRFAGEEPLDKITKQYNDTMRRILPSHGIEFVEIPRKEFDGKVISSSRVRELLKDKKFDEIAGIVPESTLNYLKEKFN